MRLVTAEEMQRIDACAIDNCGIPGVELMENAGRCCSEVIVDLFQGKPVSTLVIAGKGNNGGDGFVIARLLSQQGWDVTIYLAADEARIQGDAGANLVRIDRNVIPVITEIDCLAGALESAGLVVDALFGTGLNNDLSDDYRRIIELVNCSGKRIVSVDIPSGINASTGQVLGTCICAEVTVTFAAAKVGHVLYPGCESVGRLVVMDIGIPEALFEQVVYREFVDLEVASRILRPRARVAHKGSFGHCLIVAGSTGKTGAAALAANSAVRSGAGLVTLTGPASLNVILEIKTNEAMTHPVNDAGRGFFPAEAATEIIALAAGKSAVALGPGLSNEPSVVELVQKLLATLTLPLVIDADGLNAVARDVGMLRNRRAQGVVLTPHPGEMSRLSGLSVAAIESDRFNVATKFAGEYNVYLVLKGARTVIAAPDGRVAVNGSGNPGMASGGMGDVLTGVIVSLVGQGYDLWDACRLGVFTHGLAADLVAAEKGEMGFSAGDVQEKLPYAYREISKGWEE